MDSNIQQRVNAGAAWLDEHYKGWFEDIDLEQLELSSCRTCVLGQLGPGLFWRELDRHAMPGEVDYFDVLHEVIDKIAPKDHDTFRWVNEWSIERGFTIASHTPAEDVTDAFLDLEARWTMVVVDRLKKGDVVVNPTNDPHYFTHRRGE